jgi:flagellar biosynthesis/type III secretory pathway protein FliH
VPLVQPETTRRIAREAVEASLLAKRILGEARVEAAEMLVRAREEAAQAKAEAANEARENEVAKLAAGFLALQVADERRADRDLDRAVALACVLAERLLGEALDSDPLRVLALARQALLEARGAHRAVIEASPLDVETLRSHVLDLGSAEGSLKIIEIRADPLLSRGSLRIHTNLGNLDAQLTPQLERLAKALRDALA